VKFGEKEELEAKPRPMKITVASVTASKGDETHCYILTRKYI